MNRTCKNCPSFVDADWHGVQTEIYGKPTNLASCARRGLIISTDDMSPNQEDARAQEVAQSCAFYGEQISHNEKVHRLHLGVGVPPAAPEGAPRAKTCRSCFFYAPAARVAEKTTIPMGLCSKFGNLIPDTKAAEIAAGCGPSARLVGIASPEEHINQLLESFVVDPQIAKYIMPGDAFGGDSFDQDDRLDNSLEPSTYPTDKPVLPAQDAAGIRAWRKVTSGEREVFLPIFKREIFNEIEQAKIPATGDDEHPETYVDHMGLTFTTAALWFHLDETPSLVGKAGTGKTEFFRYMAWLMQLPFERISITAESEVDDLAGKMHFEDNETVFKPGRIPKAWVKPCVVVIDEPNTGPPEVWQYIRPLTDNSKQLVNDKNEGETIDRHKFCFLGMAMNPAWDSRNVGAHQIGDADGSRLMHIYVEMPPAFIERNIIIERCKLDGYDIPESTLNKIMDIAADIREMSDNNELPITWGVRNQIKVARATAWFDLPRAYKLGVLDYLEPDTREMLTDLISTHNSTRR